MENEQISEQGSTTGFRWLWFVGGCALSLTTICSLVLALLLVVSAGANAYLAWIMSGYEVSIDRPASESSAAVASTPTSELAVVPTPTSAKAPTSTPMPVATLSTLESERATLAAIATYAADNTAASLPTVTPTRVPGSPVVSEEAAPTPSAPIQDEQLPSSQAEVTAPFSDAERAAAAAPEVARAPDSEASTVAAVASTEGMAASAQTAAVQSAAASSNSYQLIPIEGPRESRAPDEHPDLNLRLRDPQPVQVKASLVDIQNAGSDPNAPQISAVLHPEIVNTYSIHDWDWSNDSKGKFIDDASAVLVGVKTTPGQPIFIPFKGQDIFQGKYFATLLYASEDSLTFVYTRKGNVVEGYTVHYMGLQVDPNLLKLFRESKGSELPGLTHDVPVGVATDELIVGIRDKGRFMDTRSRLDWWK
jgi:hypothetical protein